MRIANLSVMDNEQNLEPYSVKMSIQTRKRKRLLAIVAHSLYRSALNAPIATINSSWLSAVEVAGFLQVAITEKWFSLAIISKKQSFIPFLGLRFVINS